MAVSETSEVAVKEVWLIDSPGPKTNTSWATKGPLQSFCTWRSLFGMSGNIGGKHIYHWYLPNYANQMEHLR